MIQNKEKPKNQNNVVNKTPSFILTRFNNRNKSQSMKKSHGLQLKSRKYTDFQITSSFLIPATMPHDKQRLYQQNLKLKKQIHDVSEQNKRMMSQIIKLEKQNQKFKLIQQNNYYVPPYKDNKQLQRLCNSLKDRIKERNSQFQYLQTQYKNLKTSLRRTNIAELELQIKTLYQQLGRLSRLVLQLNNYKQETKGSLVQIQEMRQTLKQKVNYCKFLQQKIQKVQGEYDNHKKQMLQIKNRLNNADKKRIQQTNELKRIIANISRQKNENNIKIREVQKVQNHNSINSNKQIKGLQQKIKKINKQLENQHNKNINLQKLLQQQKQKVKQLLLKQQEKSTIKHQNKKQSQSQQKYDDDQQFQQNHQNLPQKNIQKKHTQTKKNEQKQKEQGQQQQQQYSQQFQNNLQQKQEEEEEQYQQPTNNTPQDIIKFITYKLKGFQISHTQFKSLIQKSTLETIQDLISLLQKQPFALKTNQDLQTLISSIVQGNQKITGALIKKKLYKLFPKYKIWDKDNCQKYQAKITEILQQYGKQIDQVLSQYKDQNYTIDGSIIQQLFQKMGLQKSEIEYLISKICLSSQDIHHLNYKQLFDIFLDEYEEQQDQQQDVDSKKKKVTVEISQDSYQQI